MSDEVNDPEPTNEARLLDASELHDMGDRIDAAYQAFRNDEEGWASGLIAVTEDIAPTLHDALLLTRAALSASEAAREGREAMSDETMAAEQKAEIRAMRFFSSVCEDAFDEEREPETDEEWTRIRYKAEWAYSEYAQSADGAWLLERNAELESALAALEAARRQAEENLHELRMRIEEADALATKRLTDDGEWIAGYHFNTGAWHRLLAEARKGDGAALSRPEPPAENDLLAIRDEANLALVAIADEGAGDAMRHIGNVVRIAGDLHGRPVAEGDGLREAVNLALADLRAALSMNDDPYVEEIIDHAANLLGAGMRGAGEGEESR